MRNFLIALLLLSLSCTPGGDADKSGNVEASLSPTEEIAEGEDSLTDYFEMEDIGPLAVMPDVGVGKPKPKAEAVKGHQLLTWDDLRQVTFEKKYYESEGQYFDFPTYGEEIKQREGEDVYISGYLLPVNPDSNIYVLSAYTFSSCFFCGQAGPESILELTLKEQLDESYVTDQWITFKGNFNLNADDLDHLYYILDKAEEVPFE